MCSATCSSYQCSAIGKQDRYSPRRCVFYSGIVLCHIPFSCFLLHLPFIFDRLLGLSLSECGRNDVAGSVLSSAAKVNVPVIPNFLLHALTLSIQFEEQLRNSEDATDGTHNQAKARATVAYYCSRMVTVSMVCKYPFIGSESRPPAGLARWK